MAALQSALNWDEVLWCVQIEEEVIRIMHEKFLRAAESSRGRLSLLLKDTSHIVVNGRLKGICRDPKDDFILECAQTGRADWIVTGDKDLLSLGSFESMAIVSPRRYLEESAGRIG